MSNKYSIGCLCCAIGLGVFAWVIQDQGGASLFAASSVMALLCAILLHDDGGH